MRFSQILIAALGAVAYAAPITSPNNNKVGLIGGDEVKQPKSLGAVSKSVGKREPGSGEIEVEVEIKPEEVEAEVEAGSIEVEVEAKPNPAEVEIEAEGN